jgi:Fic family protein
VSTRGEWAGWISFFLEAIRAQAVDVLRRARALQDLREQYRERVTGARSSSLLPRLVDAVFENPALTIGAVQEILGVTHRAATGNIEKLVAEGVLVEVEREGRTRLFLAEEIIAVVNGERR